eukprot:SAG31_NODE_30701_length_377_cov_0.802158_1_plen_78_part_01
MDLPAAVPLGTWYALHALRPAYGGCRARGVHAKFSTSKYMRYADASHSSSRYVARARDGARAVPVTHIHVLGYAHAQH